MPNLMFQSGVKADNKPRDIIKQQEFRLTRLFQDKQIEQRSKDQPKYTPMLKLPSLCVREIERRSKSVIGQAPLTVKNAGGSSAKHSNLMGNLNSDLEAVRNVSISCVPLDENES